MKKINKKILLVTMMLMLVLASVKVYSSDPNIANDTYWEQVSFQVTPIPVITITQDTFNNGLTKASSYVLTGIGSSGTETRLLGVGYQVAGLINNNLTVQLNGCDSGTGIGASPCLTATTFKAYNGSTVGATLLGNVPVRFYLRIYNQGTPPAIGAQWPLSGIGYTTNNSVTLKDDGNLGIGTAFILVDPYIVPNTLPQYTAQVRGSITLQVTLNS